MADRKKDDIELQSKQPNETKTYTEQNDGVEDCCDAPCCLCAPYKESCTDPVSMKLRTSETSRLILAIVLALILGPSISQGKPKKVGSKTCQIKVNNEMVSMSMGDSFDCNKLGIFADSSNLSSIYLNNLKKKIPMCLDDPSDVKVSYNDPNCIVSYSINASSSDDKIYCLGKAENLFPMSANQYVIIEGSTNECSEFSKLEDAELIDVIYADNWTNYKDLTDSYIAPNGKVALQWAGIGVAINDCDTTSEGCPSKTFAISPSVSSPANYDDMLKEYNDELNIYNQAIYYLFKFPGNLWLQGLKLIIMPMLIAGIIISVAELKDLPGAGKLGCATFLYYLTTTVLAAIESLIISSVFLIPFMEDMGLTGKAGESVLKKKVYADQGAQIEDVIKAIFPKNGIAAAFNNSYMGVIFFSIIAGGSLTNPKDSVFLRWFKELNEVTSKIIRVLILLSPLGVFCLATYLLAFKPLEETFAQAGLFLATIFTGLFLHFAVVYPSIYFLFTRKNPCTYWWNITEAACFALAVSSSLATLPITIKCAIQKNKIDPYIAKFVLTLGATINMDGTTIGFPIALVFCAYGLGMTLTFGELVMIVILSSISSMGAAPIPSAGLVLLMLMMDDLGIPQEGPFIIIMAVDWIYDRPETMTNIVGDSFAAGVLDHLFGEWKQVSGDDNENEHFGNDEGQQTEKPKHSEA